MTPARILIVEDEFIVAADLQMRVRHLGHEVAGVATNGEEAIRKAMEMRPDLLLLDIQLKDGIDGIAVAKRVQKQLDVPIVFMTAYSDSETLQRAKQIGPCGYVLKPFEERELRTTLEMALHKHAVERQLRLSEERYRVLVEQTGEGIGYVDGNERFVFANSAAENIFGVPAGSLVGRTLTEFLSPEGLTRVVKETQRRMEGDKSTYPLTIIRPDGGTREILVTATPGMDTQGQIIGSLAVFRDMTGRNTPGRVICAGGKMLPEFSLVDGPPVEGSICPLMAMRPGVEEMLLDLQLAVAALEGTSLGSDQQQSLGAIQEACENLRMVFEQGLTHLHLESKFFRFPEPARRPEELATQAAP